MLPDLSHYPPIDRLSSAICAIMPFTSVRLAQICRNDLGFGKWPQPLALDRYLPSSVRGPVDFSHGLRFRHCCRRRSRSCLSQGRRLDPLIIPAATLRGFFVFSAKLASEAVIMVVTFHFALAT